MFERRVECAQGVSDVRVDGTVLRFLVTGSFQPLLDALRGYEVVDISALPAENMTSEGLRWTYP